MDISEVDKRVPGFVKRGWAEFRDFAFKGNMIDLAIAVVIGASFKTVIDAIVGEIIQPLIAFGFWLPRHADEFTFTATLQSLGVHLNHLVGAFINFTIVAFAVFVTMVKIAGAVVKKVSDVPAPSEPTTKECPMCLSNIPIKARKCAFCTSDLLPVT